MARVSKCIREEGSGKRGTSSRVGSDLRTCDVVVRKTESVASERLVKRWRGSGIDARRASSSAGPSSLDPHAPLPPSLVPQWESVFPCPSLITAELSGAGEANSDFCRYSTGRGWEARTLIFL